jgi:hypothetical protein
VLDPSGALYTFRADADFEPYTGLSAPVASVSVSGNRVAVGGAFTNIGPPGQVEEAFGLGFAQFIDTSNSIDNTIDVPRVVGENQLAISMTPNPVVARGQVTFALPTRSPVKVEILDLAGRKVKTVLDSESWPAGTHSVPLSLGNAPGGIYFARIVAGGRSATTKIAVLGR